MNSTSVRFAIVRDFNEFYQKFEVLIKKKIVPIDFLYFL